MQSADDEGGLASAAGPGGFGWFAWLLPTLFLIALFALVFWASNQDPSADTADTRTATVPVASQTSDQPDTSATPEQEPIVIPVSQPAPLATAQPVSITASPEFVTGCASLDRVLADNGFSRLASLAAIAGPLAESGPLTVFAPTDDAFAALPQDITGALLVDSNVLASLVRYHVVGDVVASADLTVGELITLNGSRITVRTDLDATTINASAVSSVDLEAGDCTVHGIDSVLVPPSMFAAIGMPSLNTAVGGGPIAFAEGTPTLTDADVATLAAICSLVGGEESIDGLPPVQRNRTDEAAIDRARSEVIDLELSNCGPGALTTDELALPESPELAFTG